MAVYTNFAYGVLAAELAEDGTSLTITTSETFPTTGEFKAVIWASAESAPQDDSTREIMTLEWDVDHYDIIGRGEESTVAKLWAAGSKIAHVATATQYDTYEASVRLDQTTPQEIINGIPTLDETRVIDGTHELVDKLYVDNVATSLGQRFYMLSTGSGITQPVTAEEYYNTSLIPSAEVESSVTATNPADDEFIAGWISPSVGTPSKLITGVYDWDIFAAKTGGNKVFRLYWTLVERKSDDSEVLIGTSAESNLIGVKGRLRIPLALSADYTPDVGSRIVGKAYAVLVSGASATDIVLYSEGASDSHWEIPTNTEVLNTMYQPLDADLTAIAGLSSADDNFIVGSAAGWVAESGATARTSLGLGTMATATATDYALVGQTFYIGTTSVAINRASAALTLAGITLTTPDLGTPSALVLTNASGTVTNLTLVTPVLGTPQSGVMTNVTGIPVGALANGTDGQLITWGDDAVATTVATGTAAQVLTSNGAGAAPTFQDASGGGGISWSAITEDATMAVDTGSLANKGALLTLTLPATSSVGAALRIAGMNAGLWKIAQAADQYIKFGNQATTVGVGGYISSVLTYDAVELVCIEANLGWVVVSSIGNITVA